MSTFDKIAVRGTLVSTDVPAKIMIGRIDEVRKLKTGKSVLVKDLDDTHVVIDSKDEDFVRAEVERLFDAQNIYTGPVTGGKGGR